jgi:hypothetical protein
VQSIPIDLVGRIPAAAAEIVAHEQEIITLCQANEVSLDKLRAAMAKRNP